jgi:3-deoxy-D-manno-octulosonate 8-phosphate phosphatase (KDO 8-P phosphatase)
MTLRDRAKKIKLLIMDVDGVLTDGKIVLDDKGNELKFFDVQDGLGVVVFKRMGFKTAIITAKGSRIVEERARHMEIDKLYQDAFHKIKAYEHLLKEFKLKDREVCFIADELIDLGVMKKVGFAVAVANAAPELKKCAHYITKKAGGQGAVREVVEIILKANNLWQKAIRIFD